MIGEILRQTYRIAHRQNLSRHAAAVSFFALLSLAPMLLIITAVAGIFIDPLLVEEETFAKLSYAIGVQGALLLLSMLSALKASPHSLSVTIIGVLLLLYAATHVLAQLRVSLNLVFGVELKPGDHLRHFIIRKALALALISAVAILFVASVTFTTLATALIGFASGLMPSVATVVPLLDIVSAFLFMTGLFALLLKFLPDALVGWREVILGSLVTGFLFAAGKVVIALYLSRIAIGSVYGIAGSVVAVMLWTYFSAQIFFLGAAFTRAYATLIGDTITPKQHARRAHEAQTGFLSRLLELLRSFFQRQ